MHRWAGVNSPTIQNQMSSSPPEHEDDAAGGGAVERALRDDLGSPLGGGGEDGDDERAHSFRERRLTYSRHHVLSDSAAAAVAELLADGEGFSDDDEGGPGGAAEEEAGAASEAAAPAKKRRDYPSDDEPPAAKRSKAGGAGGDAAAAGTPSSPKYLPSRILHAGEIVRRFSASQKGRDLLQPQGGPQQHDARTGMYSHPTHHPQQQQAGGGHHVRNKWRQRFSFCSTAPDHVLPFPRHVVGTYSCHGMEPVYDSDYDNSDTDDDCCNGGDGGHGGIPAGVGCAAGARRKRSSTAKINQDRGGIAYPYGNSARQALFAVYDGHGEGGELVSQYALGEVQRLLEGRLRGLPSTGGSLGSVAEEGVGDDAGAEGERNELDCEAQEEAISRALREVFVKVDRGLLDEAEIEVRRGMTACARGCNALAKISHLAILSPPCPPRPF